MPEKSKYLSGPRISPEPIGPGLWEGKVRYGAKQKDPPTGESTFSFDTGGGTQHITQSKETVSSHARPEWPKIVVDK